jgi:hypothetical protein
MTRKEKIQYLMSLAAGKKPLNLSDDEIFFSNDDGTYKSLDGKIIRTESQQQKYYQEKGISEEHIITFE